MSGRHPSSRRDGGVVAKLTQREQMRRYTWRLLEVTGLLALVTVLCLVFVWALTYILPFVIGAFLAALLLPPVRALERRGVPRQAAALLVMLGIVGVLLAAAAWGVLAVASETASLLANSPLYFNQIHAWVLDEIDRARDVYGALPPMVSADLERAASSVLETVQAWFRSFGTWLLASIAHLPETVFITVISVITCYFVLLRRDRMYLRFLNMLPPGWQDKVDVAAKDMMRAFIGTIRAQLLLVLISAVLGFLGMLLLGIQYAVILAILFGIAGLVPILGSALLTVPWAIGALAVGDVGLALKVLLLQVVISIIRHIVEPKILADSVGLDTLSALFALYVGMKLVGVIGLFLGPIALIGLKSLLRRHLLADLLPDQAQEAILADDGDEIAIRQHEHGGGNEG
jgi:sporulation integral membrane protein YtvI